MLYTQWIQWIPTILHYFPIILHYFRTILHYFPIFPHYFSLFLVIHPLFHITLTILGLHSHVCNTRQMHVPSAPNLVRDEHIKILQYTYINFDKSPIHKIVGVAWARPFAPAAFGLRPRIDWASRGSFAVLASELNCEGNQASRSALLRCARSRA